MKIIAQIAITVTITLIAMALILSLNTPQYITFIIGVIAADIRTALIKLNDE